MSIRFFSGDESGRSAPRVDALARESQQALLLRLLREAGGATVSYQELRDAGIELPASIVSELELDGFPIEHSHQGGSGGRRRPGVRLNPALDPERAQDDPADAATIRTRGKRPVPSASHVSLPPFKSWTLPSIRRPGLPSVRRPSPPSLKAFGLASVKRLRVPSPTRVSLPSGRRLRELRPPTRALAPIALVTAMIVVIAVVVLALQTGSGGSRHGLGHRVAKPQPRSNSVVARAPQSSAPPTPSTPVSPALATEFEAQGHDLLQSGQYGNAVSVLRRALAATGKQLSDCLEPTSDTCLTYAYAMYDLGRALELNGEPSAALPVLEQRVQIDNQRDVVAAELAHVRAIAQP